MSVSVFILDANRDYRVLLAHHITSHWSDANVREYDPGESGRLPDEFAGAGCNLLLLGDPGDGEDQLNTLRRFRSVRGFPPVVLIGDSDDRQIVAAIKAGAADYLVRTSMTHELIVEVCEAAIESAASADDRSSSTLTSALDIPVLKGFRLERRISGGEVASVFLTRDRRTGRETVLKVLRQVPDSGSGNVAFDRFLREFELIGKISHPNVVEIFDLGIADDHAYIAMEYCGRGSLKRRINIGMYADRAEIIMRQIAEALQAIHEVGVLHRDLKPTNVLFRDDESVAVIDFGLAKQAHLRAEITGTGEIFGTPYYMSPEQGHGEPLDERSDIYSLGVMFYEMLTGEKPYDGKTAMEVIMKHAREPVPRLPDDLARYQPAIDGMMAKLPEHRFQTVAELIEWQPATADG